MQNIEISSQDCKGKSGRKEEDVFWCTMLTKAKKKIDCIDEKITKVETLFDKYKEEFGGTFNQKKVIKQKQKHAKKLQKRKHMWQKHKQSKSTTITGLMRQKTVSPPHCVLHTSWKYSIHCAIYWYGLARSMD